MSSRKSKEVWLALRSDGQAGTGSENDPYNASSVNKLNNLFKEFQKYGDNLSIHFGPGVFYGDRQWAPKNNWTIRGDGIDKTIIKTQPNPNATATVGFRAGNYKGGPTGFEISDITFDFNTPNMRKANRVFVYQGGRQPLVYYFYADNLLEWNAKETYSPRSQSAVWYGSDRDEYISIKSSQGEKPGQNDYWSILRPNRVDSLPKWNSGKRRVKGDAVARNGTGYICVVSKTSSDPEKDSESWRVIDPDAPDPLIFTQAVFICSRPPGGGHHAQRVKVINGHGSRFFNHESFNIGLGGNNCIVEDCQVEQFRGDYSTLIAVFFGQGSVVRRCTVHGNDGRGTMGYGGWACFDALFKKNYASNCRSATNIDSLTSKNVTFHNNEFTNCRDAGILVNLSGDENAGNKGLTIPIDGKEVPASKNQLDGLVISENQVQIREGAPYSAIQLQRKGLSNVQVLKNNISKTGGTPKAIGIPGGVTNVLIEDNICDPGMRASVTSKATCRNNMDTNGKPIKGL